MIGIVASWFLALFPYLAFSWGQFSISDDCKKMGKFTENGVVYECHPIKITGEVVER
jgi:hypothetical protein